MSRNLKFSPHNCYVLYGRAAVEAYEAGTHHIPELQRLGAVKLFSFVNVRELNAFLLGLEEGGRSAKTLAVDDLEE